MADSMRLPPQALEAEMAVLGSMLIERSAVETALDLIAEADFYKDAHKKVFRAILNLHEAGKAVDMVTVQGELKRLDWLGEVGGPGYLLDVIHSVSTAAHAEHYARRVHDKALLRDLITTSTKIIEGAYAEERDPAELLDNAQSSILAVAHKQRSTAFLEPKGLAHAVVSDIDRFHKNRSPVTGIPTGYARLDRMTAGLQGGDLILIAARPSQGKTALALNIAANIALDPKRPKPVAFFSIEMTAKAIMTRLIASQARVDISHVRTGFFRAEDFTHITNAADRIADSDLFISDSIAPSVLAVRSATKRLSNELKKRGKELAVVIIDYLQLMHGSARRAESRQQEVSDISRGLKFLAKDLGIPVIALSQLNRGTEEKGRPDAKPKLSDLRESGSLEQDADLVALIYREGYYKPNDLTLETKAELIIAKQRNGPTGLIELRFLRNINRFENADDRDEAPAQEEAVEEAPFL